MNFPVATNIGESAFYRCSSLVSISLGTGFITPTPISAIYSFYPTDIANVMHLCLGKYVLPDYEGNDWKTTLGKA